MSINEAKLRQLRIIDLKELLVKKGLPVSGKKEELIARILATEDNKPEDATNLNKNIENIGISATSLNFINNNDSTQSNIKTESKNGGSDPYETSTGLEEDWYKFTTEDIANLSKDSEFDTLNSPTSPSLSITSNKEFISDKGKPEVSKEKSENQDDRKNDTSRSPEKDTRSDILVKPSGFTCKKIVFDGEPTLPPTKSQSDLAAELERRKKRAERFGTQLSDADKRLQRAARFGIEASIPIDSPLKAPLPVPPRKFSIDDAEKLRKRAEKFGLDNVQTKTTNTLNEEEEKKKRRAERFETGISAASTTSTPDSSLKSSSLSEEEKKKRRAERFSANNPEPSSKKLKT